MYDGRCKKLKIIKKIMLNNLNNILIKLDEKLNLILPFVSCTILKKDKIIKEKIKIKMQI